MAIETDLTTDIGLLRFYIGDRIEGQGAKPNNANFSDDELQVLLDTAGSVEGARQLALQTLATLWARVTNISFGPRSESLGDVAKQFAAQATQGGSAASGGSTVNTSDLGYTQFVGVEGGW